MKYLKIAATVCASALALSACGSTNTSENDGTESSAAAKITATDLSHVTKDDTIAALIPEAVSKDGKLTVGDNIYYAPAEFYAEDGKTPQGFDIDLAKALAKKMGLEADIQQAEFSTIIPGIGSKYEVGISAFTITPERLEVVDMIQYFEDGNAWSVAKGNPKGFDPANKCGKAIGVQTGTWQDEMLTEANEAGGECEKDPITLQRFDTQSQVTTTLAGGQIDAMFSDNSVAEYASKITNGSTETFGAPSDIAGRGIVVAKKDKELTKATQAALQSLIDDGTLAKIFETWGITTGVSTEAVLNPNA